MHNAYLSGFVKGAGILTAVIIVHVILFYFISDQTVQTHIQIFGWLGGVLTIGYLRKKYHLPYSWVAAGIFFNWWLLPFLFGEIEKFKMSKKNTVDKEDV